MTEPKTAPKPDTTDLPIVWDGDVPRSARFDDAYFSAEDGLAESRAVYLAGCGLPHRWAGRRRFTVGELGFGSGLNVLALLALWRDTRPAPDATLHIFSIEAYPMGAGDAARALARWPELADLAAPLLAGWPDGRRGWRRVEWPKLGAVLDLAIDEVGPALSGWDGQADAWFLDGFAPARNPEMWREEVLAEVAAHSRPGARAASFTVAGAVRRGLADQGFAVERMPGFGRKKQRLEARWPGEAPGDPLPPRVAILGAGIAGASLTRAFRRLGIEARVFDPGGAGAGASGNAAALVTPRLDAGLGPVAALHAQAFARATRLYRTEAPAAILATGALQLETTPRDAGRHAKIAAWDGFASDALTVMPAEAAAARLEEVSSPGALDLTGALVVEPAVLLPLWLGQGAEQVELERLEPSDGGWRLLGAAGALLMEADVVVLAAGAACVRWAPGLSLRLVRGQASTAALPFTGEAAAWGGYAIPTRDGLLFGATHDRGDTGVDVRADDHARNLAELAKGRPALAARLVDTPLGGRAAIRAAAPDHTPLAGPAPRTKGRAQGLYVLAGLGGRGFTLAPILAEQVAAQIMDLPPPLPRALAALVRPDRFR